MTHVTGPHRFLPGGFSVV